jgi:hypothetical protein
LINAVLKEIPRDFFGVDSERDVVQFVQSGFVTLDEPKKFVDTFRNASFHLQ